MVLEGKVESVHEQMGNFSKEIETVRKTLMKRPGKEQQPQSSRGKAFNELINKLNAAKGRISELEDGPLY